MRWKSCKDGIEIVEAVQSATVTNLRGDGYLWKMTRWGIVDTEAEAKKRAEAALNEVKQLRALLEEAHERCGFASASDLRVRIEAVLR